MSRISKDPQVRISEIVDAAEELFNARGFQETQISDIVKAIGVAQGTFYYYFKSKEAVIEAIIRRKMARILAEIDSVTAAPDISAPGKMALVVETILARIQSRDGLLFELLHNEQYLHILDRLGRQSRELFAPLLVKIVDEGNAQGYFKVADSAEAVAFVIANIRCLVDSLYKKDSAERLPDRLEITDKLIAAALGAEPGILSVRG